jgi:hypothetical protein
MGKLERQSQRLWALIFSSFAVRKRLRENPKSAEGFVRALDKPVATEASMYPDLLTLVLFNPYIPHPFDIEIRSEY